MWHLTADPVSPAYKPVPEPRLSLTLTQKGALAVLLVFVLVLGGGVRLQLAKFPLQNIIGEQ